MWHSKLKATLQKIGLRPSTADPALWLGDNVIVLLYVDNALIASRTQEAVERMKKTLATFFKLRDLKEGRTVLSLSIARDCKKGLLKVHQGPYVQKLLTRYKMEDCAPCSVPLSLGVTMTKEGEAVSDEVPFGSLVGALTYLATCTRPDIAYVVGQLSRYMAAPTVEHWTIAKGVLRYLKGNPERGLLFGSDNVVCGYAAANFAGCVDTRKSTTGFVFMMHGSAVAWGSRIQPTVATSTCEAEYMAAGTAIREALWLRKLLADLGYPVGTMEIKGDNQAALKLLENPSNMARSKHIDVMHLLLGNELSVVMCSSRFAQRSKTSLMASPRP
jgi:hypothetical protein